MVRQQKSFLLRHTLISAGLLLALVIFGTLVAAPIAVHLALFKPDLNGHHVNAIAEMLEAARGNRPPEEIVREMKNDSNGAAGDFFVADQNGFVIANSGGIAPQLDPRFLPSEPHVVFPINNQKPAPGDPAIIRLRGEPTRFLVFRPKNRIGPEQFVVVAIAIFLALLVIFAMAGSSFILLRKLRKHASQAEQTMASLRHGDLKARLSISDNDEFGTMMGLFNEMASEIEHLFIRVREVEKSRVHLLQDIGHDLRTPLGSILNIFDLLNGKFDQLSEIEKREFLRTGKNEVKFTQRLVEDLLFLARVEDPSCRKQDEEFDLSALVESEVESKRSATSLEILCDVPPRFHIFADPQLMKRLLRNAIENGISFAAEKISVRVETEDGAVKIHVEDDGPGFNESAIKTFGQKRPTRIQHSDGGKRISMGLGSVIMSAIARLYEGSITPSNIMAGNKVIGGRVTITLNIVASEFAPAKAS